MARTPTNETFIVRLEGARKGVARQLLPEGGDRETVVLLCGDAGNQAVKDLLAQAATTWTNPVAEEQNDPLQPQDLVTPGKIRALLDTPKQKTAANTAYPTLLLLVLYAQLVPDNAAFAGLHGYELGSYWSDVDQAWLAALSDEDFCAIMELDELDDLIASLGSDVDAGRWTPRSRDALLEVALKLAEQKQIKVTHDLRPDDVLTNEIIARYCDEGKEAPTINGVLWLLEDCDPDKVTIADLFLLVTALEQTTMSDLQAYQPGWTMKKRQRVINLATRLKLATAA